MIGNTRSDGSVSPAPGPAAGKTRAWLVVAALLPGILLTFADATAMSVAVPLIIRRLESTVISVSWVMNGYNLVLAVLFLTMGRLADRYGHKRLFVIGLTLFTIASYACARAGSIDQLIAFRVVQAVGAAAVIPTALVLLLDAFPASRQGFAAGLFGALSSAAAALGPVLGGVLIGRWGWPAIFWLNVPVGAVGIALTVSFVRGRRKPQADAKLDWAGVSLSSAGLFCLTLALIEGNAWGWTSTSILGLFVAATALLAVFVAWELHTPSPLFDLRLFRDRTFAAASAAIMTVDIAMMGTAFMLVIFMIAMMDYSELKAGLAVATIPAAGLLLAPFSGRLVDRFGPRPLAVAGALLSAAGLFALGHLARTAPLPDVLWRSTLVGAGLGLSLPALTAAGMSVVPGGVRGAGAGVLNTARQLGFLLGVAILVAVFAHTMGTAVNRSADEGQALTRTQAGISPAVKDSLVSALDQARTIDATAGMSEIRKVAHPIAEDIGADVGLIEGFVLLQLKDRLEELLWDEVSAAFRWPFYTAAVAALLGALAGALLPRRLRRRGD
ncbi:MAG TPA: DHA2 family efflux MFS transporter permease subunit [Thermoleophilia bacterium]|nr:DHA2 family efflux MFS transporter permease subunit [Thermoleophilia bacterium]